MAEPERRRWRGWHMLPVLLLLGCAPLMVRQFDQLYGKSDPARFLTPATPIANAPEYWRDVRPLLEQRCVVCHGCYDAPCQLNLTAWDGVVRGANPELVYGTRLSEAAPSRLFVDADNVLEWRQRGFYPVINERNPTPAANREHSVLYRLLKLKQQQPLPTGPILAADDFSFELDREQSCPSNETVATFEREHPLWGMPYALPALTAAESATLEQWVEAGVPAAALPTIPAVLQAPISDWERFFNGGSAKQQLVSRYLYEHLYLAHLYFDPASVAATATSQRFFFRLVRSRTPPGQPIQEIASRRPFDDPGQSPFWYRLRWDESSVIEKTHMPYRLDGKRLTQWQQWFLRDDYTVTTLPSYDPAVASNPFIVFQALPLDARYRFLLSEAHYAVDQFIKGPVCRGQIALNVIDDHFWVFFVDPAELPLAETSAFLASESQQLRLPAEDGSDPHLLAWRKYADLQQHYLKAKAAHLQQFLNGANPVTLDLIWAGDDGDGKSSNDNAALTVFRHSDSATVVKGLVGQPPKTAWLMTYPLLERVHYLLVAGFDIYGSVGHQLSTRLYMDFLRMEGEANFLMLLPEAERRRLRDYWYRDADGDVKAYLFGEYYDVRGESGIRYKSRAPQQELYALLQAHLAAPLARVQQQQTLPSPLRAGAQQLETLRGGAVVTLPEMSVLRIDAAGGTSHYLTLLHNSAYSNNSELFHEAERRRPDEDYLTVLPGIVGVYPNAFFQMEAADWPAFVAQLTQATSADRYRQLVDRFGVRRTDPRFWAFSDRLHRDHATRAPVTAGVLDFNRLENR